MIRPDAVCCAAGLVPWDNGTTSNNTSATISNFEKDSTMDVAGVVPVVGVAECGVLVDASDSHDEGPNFAHLVVDWVYHSGYVLTFEDAAFT